jgi:aminoglycoside phosphotransferase (APT) family kinase protein
VASAAPAGAGGRLLHLDLHPLNVLMTGSGPVVIDWSTAAGGDPIVDVAMTWVLMAAGEIPADPIRAALIGRLRARFVNGFLADFESEEVRRRLREVVEWKVQDENMTDREKQAMLAFAETDG